MHHPLNHLKNEDSEADLKTCWFAMLLPSPHRPRLSENLFFSYSVQVPFKIYFKLFFN